MLIDTDTKDLTKLLKKQQVFNHIYTAVKTGGLDKFKQELLGQHDEFIKHKINSSDSYQSTKQRVKSLQEDIKKYSKQLEDADDDLKNLQKFEEKRQSLLKMYPDEKYTISKALHQNTFNGAQLKKDLLEHTGFWKKTFGNQTKKVNLLISSITLLQQQISRSKHQDINSAQHEIKLLSQTLSTLKERLEYYQQKSKSDDIDLEKSFEKYVKNATDIINKLSNTLKEIESTPEKETNYTNPVCFCIGFEASKEQVMNAFQLLGLHATIDPRKTNAWYVREDDRNLAEVWSPFVQKTDINKIINSMKKLGFSVMGEPSPIHPEQLLLSRPDYSDIIKNSDLKISSRYKIKAADLIKEIKEKGIKYNPKAPYLGIDKYKNTLTGRDGIKFLFSGTIVSDDKFVLSRRAGRSGRLYATPDIHYASLYCGDEKGESATRDVYRTTFGSTVLDVLGNEKNIGFVNVYQADPSNKYYHNFGIESSFDAQRDDEDNCNSLETLITDKNKLVAKLAYCDGYFYEYPRDDKKWQDFEKLRQANVESTWEETEGLCMLDRIDALKEEQKKFGHLNVYDTQISIYPKSNSALGKTAQIDR